MYKVASVRHMDPENLLLAFCVEIYSTYSPGFLVEADVVEAFKASAVDCPHAVIRHEKTLLPAHEDVLFRTEVRNDNITTLPHGLGVRSKGRKLVPVGHINLVGCTPVRVVCQKPVFRADNFAFEKGCESGIIFSQAWW